MSISNNTTKLQSLMDKINALPEAGAGIEAHNTDTTAHADIRNEITELADNVVYMDTTDNENVENPDGIIIVDSQLSSSSTNPVQNKVITEKINELNNEKVDKTALSLGVKDGLIYLFVNGAPVGNGIEQGVSGDVVGYVSADNTIVLTGALADGTYTVKYEMEDGSTVDIGELVMTADGPSYTNLAEPDADNTTDYSIWCTGVRIGSDGSIKTGAGYSVTNYVGVGVGDVVRIKNFKIERAAFYKADKTLMPSGVNSLANLAPNGYIEEDYTQTDIATTFTVHQYAGDTAFLRLSGFVQGTVDDVIITVNEEIPETE